MGRANETVVRRWVHWAPPAMTLFGMAVLSYSSEPLTPMARAYQDVCERFPAFAVLANHLPQLVVAFVMILLLVSSLTGACIGMTRWLRTSRSMATLELSSDGLPDRVVRAREQLGLTDRVLVFEHPACAAFCFGFIQPKIALSTGLLQRLDSEELLAVLAHERHHLVRRDPLRLLILHAMAGSAFMFPMARFVRRRIEARIELAADQAAMSVSSPGALAGALLAVLKYQNQPIAPGAVGLSATEARVRHVLGQGALPEIPLTSVIASALSLVAILLTGLKVANAPDVVQMACNLCAAIA